MSVEDRIRELERRVALLEAETHGKNGVLEAVTGLNIRIEVLSGRITALLVFGGSMLLGIVGLMIGHLINSGNL